jgi:hypothetical protein|tara:strand:- start:3302 stop:3871 length:570 start_codon:yes stop_codon:yes gene_type:complete
MKENQIKLGEKVIVSDPCYSNVDGWYNKQITNMRPGMYDTQVVKSDRGDWGNRVESLCVIHENINSPVWEEIGEVAVDSGQMSICCMTSYRNDESVESLPWLTDKGNPLGEISPIEETGDGFYNKMCDRTLSEKQWGTYESGVVSCTGFGDGVYRLEVSKMDNLVHGIRVTFLATEMNKEDELQIQNQV